jgi:hypothetical protein
MAELRATICSELPSERIFCFRVELTRSRRVSLAGTDGVVGASDLTFSLNSEPGEILVAHFAYQLSFDRPGERVTTTTKEQNRVICCVGIFL